MNKRILILANDFATIVNFRKELLSSLISDGYELIVSVPYHERVCEIEQLGCSIVNNDKMSRRGTNPVKDLGLYKYYKKLIKQLRPDIVLSFTIKPNVYGGLACRKYNIPHIANITGLSSAVVKRGLLQFVTLFLYRMGLKGCDCVFFQNQYNKDFFIKKKIVKSNYEMLPGSGVNLDIHQYQEYPNNQHKTKFAFVGRILKDKGVNELAWCARNLEDNQNVEFVVVGDVDANEDNPFLDIKNVQCVGYQKDVRPYLKEADALILPSYHEGLANVLLEASANGRPVLASNIPGCIETFDEGETGFGFPAKDNQALLMAIERFMVLSKEEKREMGRKARRKVEIEFSRSIVVSIYKKKIEEIWEKKSV